MSRTALDVALTSCMCSGVFLVLLAGFCHELRLRRRQKSAIARMQARQHARYLEGRR